MTDLRLSPDLQGDTVLWRYMSLDKFIDLVSKNHLFFSPLAFYMKTDPFEGFLPAVCLEADSGMFKGLFDDAAPVMDIVRKLCLESGQAEHGAALKALEHTFESAKTAPSRFFPLIMRAVTVNCWHANRYESEAMWRLYSDNGKSVAVETTVDALAAAIQARDSQHLVHIHPVKYVDFFDKTLQPKDCVVGGHRVPLLKRKSYQHENECAHSSTAKRLRTKGRCSILSTGAQSPSNYR